VRAAGGGAVALVFGGRPLATTRDGVAWRTVSPTVFPGGATGWRAEDLAALRPGFVTVGEALALVSADGWSWRSKPLPAECPSGELVDGRSGVILVGQEGDYHWSTETWCSSADGRTWRRLPGYPPLGPRPEGFVYRGIGPNGALVGDGERMIAYRGAPRQAAWTSFDGRTWRRVAISGELPPIATDEPLAWRYDKTVLPIGLLYRDSESGRVWLGVPRR
jgi:hypothetical protein